MKFLKKELSSKKNLIVSLLTIISFTLLHGPYLLEMASIHRNLSIYIRGLVYDLNMTSPLESSIVLKAGDEGNVEGYIGSHVASLVVVYFHTIRTS
jgi:hypothetical protein